MRGEKIVAFPVRHRRGLIRLAEQIADRGPVAAEKYLQQQLRRRTRLSQVKGSRRLARTSTIRRLTRGCTVISRSKFGHDCESFLAVASVFRRQYLMQHQVIA
jgi:hypothetical protein